MGMKKMIRTYSELIKLKTFKDRFEYLKLDGIVGEETFGFDRYMNQIFYKSREWTSVRRSVIIRDNGCDLGVEGYEIHGKILIHHMNPINLSDIMLFITVMRVYYLYCQLNGGQTIHVHGKEIKGVRSIWTAYLLLSRRC